MVEALGIHGIPIKNYYLIGPNDIKIKVTDHVVMNMKNESIYTCSLDKGMSLIDLDRDLDHLQESPNSTLIITTVLQTKTYTI